jgi:Ca2+-binding RTX toxin-like protein
MDETFTPQAQAQLAELGNLGAESSLTPQPQRPTFSAGGKLNVNGNTVTAAAEAPVVQPSQAIEIIGTPGNDLLEGTDGPDRIFGLGGMDRIAGFLSDDFIDADPGNDKVVAGGGNDTVDGDSGNDTILGDFNPNANPDLAALGDDTLNGGLGDDFLWGQNGKDKLNGDRGVDELYGGNDDDTLNGGAGNDIVEGGDDNDTINGGDGTDLLYGDDLEESPRIIGNDTISGGNGNDKIFGGRGNDKLIGNAGADELSGDRGNDELQGGTGSDRLIGVDATTVLPVPELGFGKDEIDTLTGNQNNDTFVLGTEIADGRDFSFYNDANLGNAGLGDYALIKDFGLFNNTQNLGLDKIQLAGLRSNYSLGASPNSSGTEIFYTSGAAEEVPELIGIVENVSVSQLNLANTSQFTFV